MKVTQYCGDAIQERGNGWMLFDSAGFSYAYSANLKGGKFFFRDNFKWLHISPSFWSFDESL